MSATVEAQQQLQIAVVSGKGGSGKTMFAAAMTLAFDRNSWKTLLVDGDLGTGGLTYFLGLRNVLGISGGLTELLLEPVEKNTPGRPRTSRSDRTASRGARVPSAQKTYQISDFVRPILDTKSEFLPVGDHSIMLDRDPTTYRDHIGDVLQTIRSSHFAVVIVDCRGGIDLDSLAVCREVDHIVIIVETDAASIRATQHLVDILSKERLLGKIKGFAINKAFSDPAQIAQAGTSLFRSSFLGAVPFDFDATRRFILGEIPRVGGVFASHVASVTQRAFPNLIEDISGHVWVAADFSKLSLRDPDTILGGLTTASILAVGVYIDIFYIVAPNVIFMGPLEDFGRDRVIMTLNLGMMVFGLLGAIETTRRGIGRIMRGYYNILSRVFRILTPKD